MTNYLNFKALLVCFFTVVLFSCKSSKTAKANKDINTEFNEQYRQSRGGLSGSLSQSEYELLKNQLEKELGATISDDKVILINFRQKSNNCLAAGRDKSFVNRSTDKSIEISTRFSNTYNIEDFFVYTEDAYHADLYNKRTNFKKDSGFFKERIFTSDQNCAGFLLVKLNGKFLKYYGEDYFTRVKKFLLKD